MKANRFELKFLILSTCTLPPGAMMNFTVQIITILTSMALLLPVFSGYVMALAMLITSMVIARRSQNTDALLGATDRATKIWARPLMTWLGVISFLSLWSWLQAAPENAPEAIKYWGHCLVKYGLLWCFMTSYIAETVSQYNLLARLTTVLAPVAIIHFLYCLAQRHWGIDWAHGLAAVLPENRFAYGVYRVSGFSSHPLTLGYQLCFFGILSFGLGFQRTLTPSQRWCGFTAGVFTLLTILISGSRGPQLVALVSVMVMLGGKIPARRLWIVGVIAVAAGVIAHRLGLLDRFYEVLQAGSADTRKTDWRVYAHAFSTHPWSGLGPAGFRSAISAYYELLGGDAKIGLAHNFYLQIGAELGVLGILALLFWMSTWLRVAFCLNGDGRNCFFALFGVMALSAMTQNSLRDSGVLFTLTFVTMVLANAFASQLKDKALHGDEFRKSKDNQPRTD